MKGTPRSILINIYRSMYIYMLYMMEYITIYTYIYIYVYICIHIYTYIIIFNNYNYKKIHDTTLNVATQTLRGVGRSRRDETTAMTIIMVIIIIIIISITHMGELSRTMLSSNDKSYICISFASFCFLF